MAKRFPRDPGSPALCSDGTHLQVWYENDARAREPCCRHTRSISLVDDWPLVTARMGAMESP
eukprot:9215898-Pyramimonas_sp.AAC.1